MFDTIILLAGPAEQGPLGLVLREHNPRLTIQPIGTKEEFAALDQDVSRSRAADRVLDADHRATRNPAKPRLRRL